MKRVAKTLTQGAVWAVLVASAWPAAAQGADPEGNGKGMSLNLGVGASASDGELAAQRGRQGAHVLNQLNVADQSARLNDNYLESQSTGNNRIMGHSFKGMKGIATVIQNTGNQVLIQNSTQVNVAIEP